MLLLHHADVMHRKEPGHFVEEIDFHEYEQVGFADASVLVFIIRA